MDGWSFLRPLQAGTLSSCWISKSLEVRCLFGSLTNTGDFGRGDFFTDLLLETVLPMLFVDRRFDITYGFEDKPQGGFYPAVFRIVAEWLQRGRVPAAPVLLLDWTKGGGGRGDGLLVPGIAPKRDRPVHSANARNCGCSLRHAQDASRRETQHPWHGPIRATLRFAREDPIDLPGRSSGNLAHQSAPAPVAAHAVHRLHLRHSQLNGPLLSPKWPASGSDISPVSELSKLPFLKLVPLTDLSRWVMIPWNTLSAFVDSVDF
ncbi:hypothetical protein KM043_014874 [Ampulex compressa]|nr:hypothetical protein KM043_014874 [Ampulex compressa]